MDLLDKSIVLELMKNSRVSCQELAERYNSTRGVVRKRIGKLEKIGVIQEYSMWYHLAMMDAEFVLGHVKVGQQLGREELVQELSGSYMIHAVIPLVNGDIIFHGNVVGSDGLSQLGSSIRKLSNVEGVDLHIIQTERGSKVELKKVHLHVLSALFMNSRRSVAEIARRTGLSPRRVKRALDEITSSGGVLLAIARNPARGSGASFYGRITWDEKVISVNELIDQIEEMFPAETWESYISASEPVVFTRFFTDHIKDVEHVSNRLALFRGITSLDTLVFYPARISSLVTRDRLGEDIIKAGFSIHPR